MLCQKVISILGMRNPILTYVSPCHPNIVYFVETFESIANTFQHLLDLVRKERECLPCVLIYCRRYQDCSNLYKFFKRGLGDKFTEPRDAPDIAKFRLVDMFTSCTDKITKSIIIEQYTITSSDCNCSLWYGH